MKKYNMVKISIIIPVYNTEKYLEQCLESCINQTMQDIEIIVVDDASTDNSKQILEKYQRKYPKIIRCFYKEKNQKQGAARNLGIRMAKGDYVMFVDSDDWIHRDMCKDLLENAFFEKSDMVYCDIMRETTTGEVIINRFSEEFIGNVNEKNIPGIIMNQMVGPVACIIKRNILIKEENMFPEKMFCEDTAITKIWHFSANKITKISKPLYFYRVNQSSTGFVMKKKYYSDEFYSIRILYDNLVNSLGKNQYYIYIKLICLYYAVNSLKKMLNWIGKDREQANKDFLELVNTISIDDVEKEYLDFFFTPFEKNLLEEGFLVSKTVDEFDDYYAFYFNLKKMLCYELKDCLRENSTKVWSKTKYAQAFSKVFNEMDVVDQNSVDNCKDITTIIALRTSHISNIKKYVRDNIRVIDFQSLILKFVNNNKR